MFVDVSANLAKLLPISPSILLLAYMQWWEVPIHYSLDNRFRLDRCDVADSLSSIEFEQSPQNPILNWECRLRRQKPQFAVVVFMYVRAVHYVEIHVNQ